jgi:hypothetical protein
MRAQLQDEVGGVRLDRREVRAGGFRSYREFLIYLGWLRLYRRTSATKSPGKVLGGLIEQPGV